MAAVGKELDHEYEAEVGLNVRPSKGGAHGNLAIPKAFQMESVPS
jgi:hypothetical protein